jgi:hypothetical protein
MSNYLRLAISGISVDLTRFASYERQFADTGQTEYSINCTPLDSGPAYAPKRIWNVSVHVTIDQWTKVMRIFAECDGLRRDDGNYRISIIDKIEPTVSSDGGLSSGPFYARMFEPRSQYQRNGLYPYVISFVLRELD